MPLKPNCTAEKQAAKRSGRASQRLGKRAEEAVRLALQAAGFRMIERVATPWTVTFREGRPQAAFPVAKVSGDFRAVEPGTGRSVLVEVKCRSGRLRWSDLRPHQRRALEEHHRLGGISILAWVTAWDVRLLRWPVEGFGPGRSLAA